MKYYREAELKHGRVAMAACLGWYLNAGGVHPAFNSELSNDPLKAMVELPAVGWLQFVLGCGGAFKIDFAFDVKCCEKCSQHISFINQPLNG